MNKAFSYLLILLILPGYTALGQALPPAAEPSPAPGEEDPQAIIDDEEIMEEGEAEEELERQFSLAEPGLSGVLIDRTITMIGKTFYRQFSQLSLERPVLSNTTLSVHERPDARWGSQVWIAENNRILFQATLPPRLSEIDQYVQIAADQVEEMIIQRTIMQALDSDPDLADEEI
ncbi:CsgE family curli-type amyloid fiber assembly protein [Billgrantia montanilacus]|uniref:Curli production assembly/transport component CsgE n=1 Tax=Billgrantia montanilacus TaxID=2282305 RepID=A0A368U0N1_9GAMM|nr:CsgE family curli-type amyloid fiber assembly protein [Halomonas montanilacus]RCV90615.1 hypothetical protein DU505_06710 [Halomonas montanilacus]